MPSRSSNDGSWGRRKSGLFALTNLRPDSSNNSFPHGDGSDATHGPGHGSKAMAKKSKHGRGPSLYMETAGLDGAPDSLSQTRPLSAHSSKGHSKGLSINTKVTKRPPSVLETFKSGLRVNTEEMGRYGNGEPLSATSSKDMSLSFDNAIEGTPSSKAVLIHGEVQTSAGMFRKKREYLVLTDSQIVRYKSQQKAAEAFKNISTALGRTPVSRHGGTPSAGSHSDLQTLSDSSGDKDGRVLLKQVVATHRVDDGKPYFALEVSYLDEESGHASALNLQFGNPEERDVWLQRIRQAVHDIQSLEPSFISPYNLENAARIIERENDYDPANCAIYKVVQHVPANRFSGRSSSDDVSKVASAVCFLAIGVHKVHLIQLVKPFARSSSPSLASPTHSQATYGILTIIAIKLRSADDAFEVTFRQPLQKPKTVYLASSASHEIAARLVFSENFLRPQYGHRLMRVTIPTEVEDLLPPPVAADLEENGCLDRTLTAYCVAYGVNPANVRYAITDDCEDGRQFELLPPGDPRRRSYGAHELLAIMRALRYNESFGSLSFAGISLDSLASLHDNHGQEHVCTRTKRGTPIRLTSEELVSSSLLIQEVRALAVTSRKLRRMDFSGCVTISHTSPDPSEDEPMRTKDIGCGIVEALLPLCKHQTTNVDWIRLNGIELSETDLDYLVGAAADKSCHFRAIEMNRCGLSDRSLGLVLDALRAQENTLESLEIAGNGARLHPAAFDSQLGMFGFLRKLNLSNVSITSGSEPFIQAETLLIWRLQELRLTGTNLNAATVDAIATYLAHPQSSGLRQLYLDNTYLSGSDIATILHSLALEDQVVRSMHLDLSTSLLTKGLEKVTQAISAGKTPSHLSMRAIEYREELHFRKVVTALAANKTIQYLDMSQTALPGDAGEETCRMLSKLLAENETLVELDISGDDSRLATSKFGAGINDALSGLRHNKTLQVIRVERQKLGFQGASTLAEVLRVNNTLLELHCDNNEVPLHGLTDLVNALVENTTLLFMPPMNDGRAAAFKSAEATMKVMADQEPTASTVQHKPSALSGASAMKKGLANVRKTAQRTASNRVPSFPSLASSGRSSSSPETHRTTSPSPFTMPRLKTKHSPASSINLTGSPFTVQDVQTTHRLLTEQWDRQCYRLEQYLHRNWCLINNVPVEIDMIDEKFERPSSVGSIGKMLEQVKHDTTPKAERMQYFDALEDMSFVPSPKSPLQKSTTIESEKHSLSFKHYILESESRTLSRQSSASDLSGDATDRAFANNSTGADGFADEPRTPTQTACPAV